MLFVLTFGLNDGEEHCYKRVCLLLAMLSFPRIVRNYRNVSLRETGISSGNTVQS